MSDFLKGKLENQEIQKKLSEYNFTSGFKPSEKLIESLLEQFWFRDFYNSFISDPVFLNYLQQYLNITKSNKFNRYDFYEFVFGQVLKDPKERKVLQQIALAFEKLQIDATDPASYEGLLKTAEASGDMFSILWMEKNHLAKIGEREGKTLFIWEHHTLTEYLVAEYLLENKNFLEEFQRLAILEQEGITAFKSSWSGVLRFLMESKNGPEINSFLVEFLEKNPDNIDDNLSELLVYEATEQTPIIKSRIFKLIYNSYFERIFWLPVWARTRISKLVDQEFYNQLKEDIKEWSNKTETFVKRGNVVSIVEGLLESKSSFITEAESKFWLEKLIEFANNPNDDGNGVLQRHSLAALAHFKDETIIPKVAQKCFEETQDSLILDQFIEFCIITAPNSKVAIDYFIKGIKKGSTIYARHGLYKITEKEAIKYFLQEISEDEIFLKSFLQHESIFDKEEGDHQLIENIKKILDKDVILFLKKIIFNIFKMEDHYQEERSNFIKQTVLLVNNNGSKFIFEILDQIKGSKDEIKARNLFFDYEETLAVLLSVDNLTKYFDEIASFPEQIKSRSDSIVYIAKRINGEIGQAVYNKAIELKKVQSFDEQEANIRWKKQEEDREQKKVEELLHLLDPSPGKYMPDVFGYYLQNQKELDKFFSTKEGITAKERLIKLAIDEGIQKIDPKEFKVSIPDKNTRQFTLSSVASYFGDVLSIVKTFQPEVLMNYKQRIIDFIPYAFSNDMGLIKDLIPEITDEELNYVNQVMSDPENDRRYLIPGTYIYLVGFYAKKSCVLPSSLPILKSFIGDEYIPDYEQEAAIETIPLFIDNSDTKTKEFLMDVFKKEINGQKTKLAKMANAVLIQVYKDEEAISWRVERIKKPLLLERREGVAHTPSDAELEIDWMAFANPLLELRDETYLSKFFDLLAYSFEVLSKKETEHEKKEYWEYVNYLWRITISFVENLKDNGSFKPLLEIEEWASKHSEYENSNWLIARLGELRKVYIDSLGRAKLEHLI